MMLMKWNVWMKGDESAFNLHFGMIALRVQSEDIVEISLILMV